MKAIAFSEKLKRRSEHPWGTSYHTDMYYNTGNTQAAVQEHQEGFGTGSGRTRGIVTGIRKVPKGLERLKTSGGCNELRRESNKVQMSSGDRMEAHQSGGREERTK